jgi:hypothetical protein
MLVPRFADSQNNGLMMRRLTRGRYRDRFGNSSSRRSAAAASRVRQAFGAPAASSFKSRRESGVLICSRISSARASRSCSGVGTESSFKSSFTIRKPTQISIHIENQRE